MYRTPELSSRFLTAFAWCDFILSITRTAARPLFYCVFAAENVCICPPSKALFEAIRHILARFQDSENKESHDKTAFVNGLAWLFSYRSGETRTRGLLLPKQARYQLRNTPAVILK